MSDEQIQPAATQASANYHTDLVNHVNAMIDYINVETQKHQELLKIVTDLKNQLVSFHASLAAVDTTVVDEAVKEAKVLVNTVTKDVKKAKGWFSK